MTGHRDTWRLWLEQLTKLDGETAESVAEALSLAAPDGPVGVPCVDTCRCHDGVPASLSAMLYAELCDRGVYRLSDGERAIRRLRDSVALDTIVHGRRPQIPIRELAEIDVIVSRKNGDVAHARRLFPRTWTAIEEAVGQSSRRR